VNQVQWTESKAYSTGLPSTFRNIGSVLPNCMVFAMDYRFSINVLEMKTTVRSLLDLYEQYIYDEESCARFAFSDKKYKEGRWKKYAKNHFRLHRLYDLRFAKFRAETGNYWVMVLLNGEDTTRADPSLLLALNV